MESVPRSLFDPIVGALALAAGGLGLVLHATLGPADTFWTIDNGGKALVVANLAEGRAWIEYPGQELDPDLSFFPQPLAGSEPYGRVIDGRVVSQYLSPFTWLALPFHLLLGFAGMGLLPAIGGGGCVLLGGELARTRTGSAAAGRRASAILLLATPLIFYSSVFWEHTIVAALVTGAFLLLARAGAERGLIAGLLVGTACLLREETALLLVAIAIALAASGRSRAVVGRFMVGGVAGLAALGLFGKLATGAWTGIHVGVNRPEPFVHAGQAVDALLLGPGASGLSSLWTLGCLGSLLVGRILEDRHKIASGTLVVAGGVGLTFLSMQSWLAFRGVEDQALALIGSNSALVFLPWALVVPFLATPRGGSARRDPIVLSTILFITLFVVLVPERSITGVHPGPRMLLPIVPAIAVLAAERWTRRGTVTAVLALTLAAGLAWSARSVEILGAKRRAAGRLAAALESDPRRIVATDLFWLPTELAPLWSEKQFHLIGDSRSLAALARSAAAAGEREMLVVTAPGAIATPPVARVRHPSLPSFSADLHVQPLVAAEDPSP